MTELRSEKFAWFGPSPIEPFNSGEGRVRPAAELVQRPLVHYEEAALPVGLVRFEAGNVESVRIVRSSLGAQSGGRGLGWQHRLSSRLDYKPLCLLLTTTEK